MRQAFRSPPGWACGFAPAVMLLASCGGGGGSAPNAPPRLDPQGFSAVEDTVLAASIKAEDPGDTVTFAVVTGPANGTLGPIAPDGGFTYTPRANFNGDDSFTVSATDKVGATVSAAMRVTVRAVNDPPEVLDDRLQVAVGDRLRVLDNDRDVDGDRLTVSIVGVPFPAAASVASDGTIDLRAPAGYRGVARVRYRVTDVAGASAEATAVAFVGIRPFQVLFTPPAPAAVQPGAGAWLPGGLVLHDLVSAQSLAPTDRMVRVGAVAADGSSIVFSTTSFPVGITADEISRNKVEEIRWVELATPGRARVLASTAAEKSFRTPSISADGRYVVYAEQSIAPFQGVATASRLFRADARGGATPLEVLLPAALQLPASASPLKLLDPAFEGEGAVASFRAATTDVAVLRVDAATGVVTRVSPPLVSSGTSFLAALPYSALHVLRSGELGTAPYFPGQQPSQVANNVALYRAFRIAPPEQANSAPAIDIPFGSRESIYGPWLSQQGVLSQLPRPYEPTLVTPDRRFALLQLAAASEADPFGQPAPSRVLVARVNVAGYPAVAGGTTTGTTTMFGLGGVRSDSGAFLAERCDAGACRLLEIPLAAAGPNLEVAVEQASVATSPHPTFSYARYGANDQRVYFNRGTNEAMPALFRLEFAARAAPGRSQRFIGVESIADIRYDLDASGEVVVARVSPNLDYRVRNPPARVVLLSPHLPNESLVLGEAGDGFAAIVPR